LTAPTRVPPPAPRRPLIVRLRNWVGDVTLSLPMLQRLSDAGFALELLGKGWAADLLAGHGWPVHKLAATAGARIAQLRRLASDARAADPGFTRRINTLCLPDSFSSALECRAAGLRALGHAWEARSLLLARAVARPRGVHELDVYWRLGNALLGAEAPLPKAVQLRLAPRHLDEARARQTAHGLVPGYIVICPFAGGTWSGQDKTWPGFPAFAAGLSNTFGRRVVVCPGPGEEAVAQERFGAALCLNDVGLGAYAALLKDAALMISNDTGPGHLAAAVGTPLLSVLGPSDASLWHAWGPQVRVLQGAGTWPAAQTVEQAVREALATTPR
jgi:heptosyltransferase II